MSERQGVVAAIGAAVNAYLEAEESARLAAAAPEAPSPPVNIWALFGRDEIMKANALWQLRIVRK